MDSMEWSIVPPHVNPEASGRFLVRSRAHSGLLCVHPTRRPRARASAVGQPDARRRRNMRITSNAAPRTSAQAQSGWMCASTFARRVRPQSPPTEQPRPARATVLI